MQCTSMNASHFKPGLKLVCAARIKQNLLIGVSEDLAQVSGPLPAMIIFKSKLLLIKKRLGYNVYRVSRPWYQCYL